MRGRLINPFLADIARVDYAGTAADPDAGGPLQSGYDADFTEPVKLSGGAGARLELPLVRLPCQVEVNTQEQQAQIATGNAPRSNMRLVFHMRDLENAGLIDDDGAPTIRVNDRVDALYNSDGSFVQRFLVERGGLYITEAQTQSFGLIGARRNLLVCTVEERAQGAR